MALFWLPGYFLHLLKLHSYPTSNILIIQDDVMSLTFLQDLNKEVHSSLSGT